MGTGKIYNICKGELVKCWPPAAFAYPYRKKNNLPRHILYKTERQFLLYKTERHYLCLRQRDTFLFKTERHFYFVSDRETYRWTEGHNNKN